MDIRIEEKSDLALIHISGHALGGPDGAVLHEKLHLLKDKGLKNVVVNLSDVGFMNSSGLGMLISGMTTLRNAGGDLRLSALPEKVRTLLVVTKLSTVFKVFDTDDDAMASFA